jgi:hypothetical protein
VSGEDCLPAFGRFPARFVGMGEIATQVRAMDWSDVPVRPIQEWRTSWRPSTDTAEQGSTRR